MTMIFSNDLIRSVVLGFVLGSAAMAMTFAPGSAQAAPVITMSVVAAGR